MTEQGKHGENIQNQKANNSRRFYFLFLFFFFFLDWVAVGLADSSSAASSAASPSSAPSAAGAASPSGAAAATASSVVLSPTSPATATAASGAAASSSFSVTSAAVAVASASCFAFSSAAAAAAEEVSGEATDTPAAPSAAAAAATTAAAAAVGEAAELLNLPDSLQTKIDRDTAAREAWTASCAELAGLPVLATLARELRLDVSFGYVTLLRQVRDGDAGPGELGAAAANKGWSVADVVFGIPIFDAALNRAVCTRVRTHRLLSEANAIRAARVQRETALDLLDFIAQHQCLPLNVSAETAPMRQAVAYPTESLQCVNGVITPFVET
eukprot:m.83796 g.83796  ORF g.83796 m.83796 type:complete len:328 (+) comp13458_c0_seq3:83-1066(+)